MSYFPITVALLCLVFAVLIKPQLLIQPSIWPDEAIVASIATNIQQHNTSAINVWRGLLPGAESHALFYPPLFFHVLATWFTTFGSSITTQRLLSVTLWGGTALIIFLITRRSLRDTALTASKQSWIAVATTLLISTDFALIRAGTVSRPEIIIICLATITLYGFLRYRQQQQVYWLILSSIAAGLASFTHLLGLWVVAALGISLAITAYTQFKTKLTNWLIFCISFVPLTAWLLWAIPHWSILQAQVGAHLARKNTDQSWLVSVFTTNQPIALQLLTALQLATTVWLCGSALRKRSFVLRTFTIFTVCAWLAFASGKMFWYTAFPLPFLYLGIMQLTATYKPSLAARDEDAVPTISNRILIIIVVSIAVMNLLLHIQTRQQNTTPRHYQEFAAAVAATIPRDATVYLSSIPDPYYVLREKANTIYEFPTFAVPQTEYYTVLDATDYIIFNGAYEPATSAELLLQYIQNNAINVTPITAGGYNTNVIKLAPRENRQH